MKELGDGKSIQNEILYGTDEKINIQGKLFFISNHTPSFDSDGGMNNRYRQLQFNSEFMDKLNEDDYENKKFKKDKNLPNKIKDKYKFALLELLFRYGNQYYKKNCLEPMPEELRELTKETLNVNSGFKNWFEEHFEIGEDYRTSKDELMKETKLDFKELNDELKKINGIIYCKQKKVNKVRGLWEGFRIKKELINSDDEG